MQRHESNIYFDFRHDRCDAINAVTTTGGQVECSFLHFVVNIADAGINVTKNENTTVIIKGEVL